MPIARAGAAVAEPGAGVRQRGFRMRLLRIPRERWVRRMTILCFGLPIPSVAFTTKGMACRINLSCEITFTSHGKSVGISPADAQRRVMPEFRFFR